jgi:hypothetical protein
MIQVSTNLTLFLKIFLPVFYLVFFGSFVGALWIQDYEYVGSIEGDSLRYGATFLYLAIIAVIYFSVFKLKRVEMDADQVYVTNYVKHFKYGRENVEKITVSPVPFFRLITITFKKPGRFGKSVKFIPSMARFNEVLAVCPEWQEKVVEKA